MDQAAPSPALTADRALLRDQERWIARAHETEAEVILAALRESEDRDRRKALSARLVMIRRDALLAIGLLYAAIEGRRASSLAQALITARASDLRATFRRASAHGRRPFWEFLDLPAPDQVAAAGGDSARAAAYADTCARRAANLGGVAGLARQDMLLTFLGSDSSGQILVDNPQTVGLLKTGESELRDTSNTAFYVVDMSGGQSAQADDLVAVACPTTPSVLDQIAADIALVDGEAAETVALVRLVDEVGLLHAPAGRGTDS